jgi:hypothetical protein
MRRMSDGDAVDLSRLFMPERLTALYHTPGYGLLSADQRRRYNQLQACYLHEQIIFFESVMARPILRAFARCPLPGNLAAELGTFMAEEEGHSEMFRALNRRCEPGVYWRGDFSFIRLAAPARIGLALWVRLARHFPFFLWVLLIQEERALFYAREFLRDSSELEPSVVEAQRRHLADEAGHVKWDERLLDWAWPRVGRGWRRVNAQIFGWMMREYFVTPKRSGWRVVCRLIEEYPDLGEHMGRFRAELLALGSHQEYSRLAYSREVTPRAFARFDSWPEFAGLGRGLPCYRPSPTSARAADATVRGPSR